jgi:hypothetical protein
MYYLETSSLRRLTGELKNYQPCQNWFTSGLSISELLSGMSNENFIRRRNILRTILDSKLGIMWESPIEMIWSAFSALEYPAVWSRDLKSLAEIIKESPSLDDVAVKCQTANLTISLENLREVDVLSTKIIRLIFSKGLDFMDKMVGLRAARSVYKKVISQFPCNLSEKLRQRSLFGCLIQIAEGIVSGFPNSSIDISQLLMSYTGSLQYYIEAVYYYTEHMIIESRTPDKNDCLDLSHFLYLQGNATTKMVSDDKLITNICADLWPRKYRTSSNIGARRI